MNNSKTWLVVKPEAEAEAREVFLDSQINVTTEGRPYLGALLGSQPYIESFVCSKVDQWRSTLSSLVDVASSSPHAAYAAFTHGISSLWTFLCRTTPNICHLLAPLEDLIRTSFIPAFTGRAAPGDQERGLFALPARLGGLALVPPTTLDNEYNASLQLTSPLSSLIVTQSPEVSFEVLFSQWEIRSTICWEKGMALKEAADTLVSELPSDLRHAVLLAQEKGASSWLTSLPIREHGFALHKGAFCDALALRYGWIPKDFPVECICGKHFTDEHALSCN